ncbi:hypothetical protein SAMN04488057_10398 [Cyclobacterium lianum]|uniref:Cytochrome C and Quinol oxidase polypeptide I n=1 Tax=Cyclobacterium lianum TaxID=388280 RepID=A0A1M7L3W2_9BACT|nr:hypothetical protein [Cyclobacterium lianum]SHM72707.1 hypothetical protein SAMN04488057_10398 [Cyclobacterium lianum]
MTTGFQHLHSYLAYLVLAGIVFSFILALFGALSGKTFGEKDRKFGLIGMILAHIQLLVGIVLYFLSPLGFSNLSGETMGDSMSRLYALEHPLINILAVALITVGYSRAKKLTESRNQFRSIYMFYGVALILILSRIPWASWLN